MHGYIYSIKMKKSQICLFWTVLGNALGQESIRFLDSANPLAAWLNFTYLLTLSEFGLVRVSG